MALYLKTLHENLLQLPMNECGPNGHHLKNWISEREKLPIEEIVLSHDGLPVQGEDLLESDGFYHVILRLRGGKGGFGSMLRMLGAQIEKTTNHEACRDLSGRRMRDVNNEKKLADWISKKADREREREERRQAKLERLRSEPRHRFIDPNYHKQKSEVSESLDEAITQGIQVSVDEPSTSSSEKRKHDDDQPGSSKRSRLWVGVEEASDSDDSESEEESETPPSFDPKEDQGTDDLSRLEVDLSSEDQSSSNGSPVPDMTAAASANQGLQALSADRPTSSGTVDPSGLEVNSSSGGQSSSNGSPVPDMTAAASSDQGMPATSLDRPTSSGTVEKEVPGLEDPSRLEVNPSSEGKSSSTGGPVPDMTATESSNQGLPSSSSDRPTSSGTVEEEAPGTVSTDDSENGVKQDETDADSSETDNKDEAVEFSLDEMESATDLEAFGLERLKTELMARGLKCGGTLQERARRLFSVKGLTPDQIDPSLKAKPSKGKKKQKTK